MPLVDDRMVGAHRPKVALGVRALPSGWPVIVVARAVDARLTGVAPSQRKRSTDTKRTTSGRAGVRCGRKGCPGRGGGGDRVYQAVKGAWGMQ